MIACYGLFLYELLPEYIFNPASALYYFVLPSIIIAAIFIALPKLLSKKTHGVSQSDHMISNSTSQVDTVLIEQTKDQDIILPDNGETRPSVVQDTAFLNETPAGGGTQAPVVDEATIQDMVSRSMEPVQKDATRMQDTISDLRNEINAIKDNMNALTATVESSLTDLKSFQAELANPLNFMRKYFDSIDIKSLSDPTLPLHVDHFSLPDSIQTTNSEKNELDTIKNETQNTLKNKKSEEQAVQNHDISSEQNEIREVLPFKQILGAGITLGKLMTTISLMEEILQTLGRDSIDVLIDQCKMMGLKSEDEHIVYNVINMMDKSGLSVNDTLIMLYKFGRVMNMNDRESDLIYAKLMVNQGKSHDIVATEKKVN
ncbi:MAG: hypothetical protein KGI02_05180 [Thaumarchaeota archaeon]|nr:hypothetical protein [Nitrososphaerota archaeon]